MPTVKDQMENLNQATRL